MSVAVRPRERAPRPLPRLLQPGGRADVAERACRPLRPPARAARRGRGADRGCRGERSARTRRRRLSDAPQAARGRSAAAHRSWSRTASRASLPSHKDKLLMRTNPHLVLDGAVAAAAAVGARQIVIAVGRNAASAHASLAGAIAERARAGSREQFELVTIPDRFVAGEETALVQWLNGGPAKPAFVPPRPYEKGVRGRPTLVQNVETLANIALIARHGAGWFRELGSDDRAGLDARHARRRRRPAGHHRAGIGLVAARRARALRRVRRTATGAADRRLLRHLGAVRRRARRTALRRRSCGRSAPPSALARSRSLPQRALRRRRDRAHRRLPRRARAPASAGPASSGCARSPTRWLAIATCDSGAAAAL